MLQCEGSKRALALPALRTVQVVLPHMALQLVVSSSVLACPLIGFVQSEKPMGRKESIWPALMLLRGTTKARTFFPLAQERPESSTDKAVDVTQRRESRVGRVSDLYFHWEVCHGDSAIERRCPWYSFP